MNQRKFSLIKLKIKAKHLAAEPAIIKHEEAKLPAGWARDVLRDHRVHDVCNEARATQLAIAFLKHQPYHSVEPALKEPNHVKHKAVAKRIVSMIRKYGNYRTFATSDLNDWSDGAL